MRNLIVSAPRMLALLGAILSIGASAQASQTHKETCTSSLHREHINRGILVLQKNYNTLS